MQGVFFRDSTRRAARELGLTGWVRNLPDGRVEAVFEGTREGCRQALEWARVGPPAASVTRVESRWEEEEGGRLIDFEIRF